MSDQAQIPSWVNELRTAAGVPLISVSIDDAQAATGISRTKLYEWIKAGRLTARKADGRTIVETAELFRAVRSLPIIGSQSGGAVAA